MLIDTAVSDTLYQVIKDLMKTPLLNGFNLGGGTNLAIKYNHRKSIDIDLFSESVVGLKRIRAVKQGLEEKYTNHDFNCIIENSGSEALSFIRGQLLIGKIDIKIDIIQNVPVVYPVDKLDGIRLINDLDIGSLKLLSAANRGNQKDFYDLLLLIGQQAYSLELLYDTLLKRYGTFNDKELCNLFTIPTNKPIHDLKKDLTPLADFNNGADRKNPGNRILFTKTSPIKISWPEAQKKIKNEVILLADKKSLNFEETPRSRTRGRGSFL